MSQYSIMYGHVYVQYIIVHVINLQVFFVAFFFGVIFEKMTPKKNSLVSFSVNDTGVMTPKHRQPVEGVVDVPYHTGTLIKMLFLCQNWYGPCTRRSPRSGQLKN